jgi:two-component system, OmpR family, response regulator
MDHHEHVLIVDDDQDICEVLREYLEGEGYRISVAHNGTEMHHLIDEAAINLVLLDLVLPGEDGLALARALRAKNKDLGIIMVSGHHETIDRIVGLELGADDYIAKPFHLREILARIRSVSRRLSQTAEATQPSDRPDGPVHFAGWCFDLLARQLTSPAGEDVHLTGGEFNLLATFVANPNQVLSRDRLLDLVSGREAGPFDRTIDVQVGRLRRKLNDDPQQPQLIKTIRSGGYMFTVLREPTANGDPLPAKADGPS